MSNIRLRLYKSICIVGVIISIFCIVGNMISSFPIAINIKWLVLLLICGTAFVMASRNIYTSEAMFVFFFCLILFFLPFAYLDSGGSNNNAIGYVFILLILITYLFSGWKQYLLVIMLIAVFVAVHALEYYYPGMVKTYSAWSQFLDRMIQIPLLLMVTYLIIYRFADEYEQLNNKLSELANYDELTGLYNRRVFNRRLEDAWNRNDERYYLVLIDLDYFKQINDNYGHSIGDEVLKKFSRLLAEAFIGSDDTVCRWGGDEFSIIYYGERLDLQTKLKNIEKTFINFTGEYGDLYGFSASVVSVRDYDNVTKALMDADRLLYKDKQHKRELV